MNVKALKFQAVKAAVDVYLGEDDRGISILDRVVGAVKRAKETPGAMIATTGEKIYPTRTRALNNATKEIDKMDAFKLSENDLAIALAVATILLWGE